jgi:hypothetical protein
MSSLIRLSGQTPVVTSGQSIPEPERRLTYGHPAQVFTGWSDMPDVPPVEALWDTVERSKTVRRGDNYVQRIVGWALTTSHLLRAVAERPLRQLPDGRLAPTGPWTVQVTRRPVTNVVRLAPKQGGEPAPTAGVAQTREPLEVLPSSVQRLLRETGSEIITYALLFPGRCEIIRALAVGDRHLIAVRAERGPNGGPWQTLDVLRADLTGPPGIGSGSGRGEIERRAA